MPFPLGMTIPGRVDISECSIGIAKRVVDRDEAGYIPDVLCPFKRRKQITVRFFVVPAVDEDYAEIFDDTKPQWLITHFCQIEIEQELAKDRDGLQGVAAVPIRESTLVSDAQSD